MSVSIVHVLVLVALLDVGALNCDSDDDYKMVMKTVFTPLMKHCQSEKCFKLGGPEVKAFNALCLRTSVGNTQLCTTLLAFGNDDMLDAAMGLVMNEVSAMAGTTTNYTAEDAAFYAKASSSDFESACNSVPCIAYAEALAASGWMINHGQEHFVDVYSWILSSKGGDIFEDGRAKLFGDVSRLPFTGPLLNQLLIKYNAPLVMGMLTTKAAGGVWEYYHGRITVSEMNMMVGNAVGTGAGAIAGARAGSAIGAYGGALICGWFYARAAVMGGAAGGVIGTLWGRLYGAKVGSLLSDALCGIDPTKEAKLDKAYEFIGVPATATNSEVNRAYKQLAKDFHADKAGQDTESQKKATEKMTTLNVFIEVIREARASGDFDFDGNREGKQNLAHARARAGEL